MGLPIFFICGTRAVKFEKTEDDHVRVLVFDEENNVFTEDIRFLSKVYTSNESEEVTEKEFNEYIEKLRKGEI